MATKTFSGRVDVKKLEYAESVAQRDAGMSFGQFCSTQLLDYVCDAGSLPSFPKHGSSADPFSTMRLLSRIHS